MEVEVKFAYRHEVSGCAALSDLNYKLTSKHLKVSAKCEEMHDHWINYELLLPFWGRVV